MLDIKTSGGRIQGGRCQISAAVYFIEQKELARGKRDRVCF